MNAAAERPDIAVLLGTYNGATYLRAQLRSIGSQQLAGGLTPRLTLYVSDDGSRDDTRAIIAEFGAEGTVRVVEGAGPCMGFAENFRHLVLTCGDAHDIYLFCDQDDLWHADKLQSAISRLAPFANAPAMVCGRTLNIDETGARVGLSPLFSRQPSFRNALVQSIAGANTMAFNRLAFALLRRSAGHGPFVSHDWWTYLIVTGAGGTVIYVPEPTISYRQHAGNVVGANTGLLSRLDRIRRGLRGQFRDWNQRNIGLLALNSDLLTQENRAVLADFRRARSRLFLAGLPWLLKSGVYRQTLWSNLHLYAACAFAKL
ncbi:glycosyltransferase involved in cell wall biosynthesis [Hoeflea marina]|uniref:Glycosyltransferase involved in cell wall biosynthesis n=1 Tax=Hoeflea marina TaxID=274592 RepID=A0A317PJP3_9HYPH|nr:glycosyltransferase [Hoeflea marina]PWW00240.1 glycosyltransferase involved in cell wall biosynthesis [Hoeflea marina]